jgi:uncharacterized membrane protein
MARAPSLTHLVRHRAALRLLVACLAGGTTVLVFAALGEGWPLRLVAGWDAFALVLLTLAWSVIWSEDAARTRARAAGEDPGRRMVWVFTLAASSASLFAAVVVLRQAHHLAPGRAALWLGLCVTAVGSAWLLTHTSWALRYAHLYYRGGREGVGGLTFPGERDPDQLDFAYFAFTVGMCFQTSDVAIASPRIRRAVLFHAVQSFAFTTAIIALALNLVVGFVG